jgi:hypothetical protein
LILGTTGFLISKSDICLSQSAAETAKKGADESAPEAHRGDSKHTHFTGDHHHSRPAVQSAE